MARPWRLTGRSIEIERFINVIPERVFQALTEKEDMERWFVQKAEVDLRPGRAIRLEWAPDVLEPPHRLSYTWEALEPSPVTITFALTAENDGTRLHFIHTGIGEGENWDDYYTALNSGSKLASANHLGTLVLCTTPCLLIDLFDMVF